MKTKWRLIIILFFSVCILIMTAACLLLKWSLFSEKEEESVQELTQESVQQTDTSINSREDISTGQSDDTQAENVSEDIQDNDISDDTESDPEEMASKALNEQVEETVRAMSTEEKVAQLFFITPEALTGYQQVTAAGDATKTALDKYLVGGIVYFAQNLVDPEQTRGMLSNVQEYALQKQGIPLFLGVDEEGGRVLRVGSNESFSVEHVEAMGKLVKEQNAGEVIYHAGDTIGAYLSELGFNVDFAPDADVLVNADNQVIGDRSFGEDPEFVADMAWSFAQGLHDNHVLSCYKHFPGHGGTVSDSHTGAAHLNRTLEELYQTELVPFGDGSRKDIDFIMVSHISDVNVTGNNEPASLSKLFVTDILRNELNYEGIIITDSLSMGAVTEQYNSGKAAVLALQAGCDMILMPQDFSSAYQAVMTALTDGTISEKRLNESVARIVKAKVCWMRSS